MSVQKIDYIELKYNIIDSIDPTKQLNLSLEDVSTNTVIKLNVPNTNTTIVGTDVNQQLTNKIIDGSNNTLTNINNSSLSAGIDATKIADGTVSNTEFQRLNGITSQVVGISDTQTLTNKTIDGSNNTLTNISNSSLSAGIDATKIADGTVSNTEFQRLNGITSQVVGISDTQILTNKTIQGSTNIVDADNLKTTGTSVSIASAAPPSIGQILTATSSTSATWQTPSLFNVYLNNNGTVTNPNIGSLKQFYGRSQSSGGICTFIVTTNGLPEGPAIFADLSNAYMLITGRRNTTSNTQVPFCSIRTVSLGKIVEVNVKTGRSDLILIGGTYTGITEAPDGTDVYLYIIGT